MPATLASQIATGLREAWWLPVAWFAVSAVILDLFNISLPRGDSIGVTGALCGAGLVLLGPAYAAIICLGSELVAHVIRRGVQSPGRLAATLAARLSGLLAGTLALQVINSSVPTWSLDLAAPLVPAIFLLGELLGAQAVTALTTQRPFGRLMLGNLVVQAPLLLAEWSASLLLLITFGYMGSWSLVPVVVLLLLMRQAYALFLSIRETYRTTVEVLVEAAERQDVRLAGHAERTAEIARRIATRLGLTFSQVELVSYAALLHDIDVIGAQNSTTQPEEPGRSSAVFEGAEFFADVLPVLRICDGNGEEASRARENELVSAMIVAIASDADSADRGEVAAAHRRAAVSRVAPLVSAPLKARVVASAIELGYKTPAVS